MGEQYTVQPYYRQNLRNSRGNICHPEAMSRLTCNGVERHKRRNPCRVNAIHAGQVQSHIAFTHQRSHALHQALFLAANQLAADQLALHQLVWLSLFETFIMGLVIASHIAFVIKNS
jgi:hypothetical protein